MIERDPETQIYVGYVPGFPGAHSQGETLDELHQKLQEVIEMLLEDETASPAYEELREAAAANRPLSNLIETAALSHLREQQFVDDAEMAEILTNERLRERLQSGSAQARRRQGREADDGEARS